MKSFSSELSIALLMSMFSNFLFLLQQHLYIKYETSITIISPNAMNRKIEYFPVKSSFKVSKKLVSPLSSVLVSFVACVVASGVKVDDDSVVIEAVVDVSSDDEAIVDSCVSVSILVSIEVSLLVTNDSSVDMLVLIFDDSSVEISAVELVDSSVEVVKVEFVDASVEISVVELVDSSWDVSVLMFVGSSVDVSDEKLVESSVEIVDSFSLEEIIVDI